MPRGFCTESSQVDVACAQEVLVAVPHHELQAVEVSVAFRKVARKGVPKDVLLPVFKACCSPDLPPPVVPVAGADALLGGASAGLF